MSPPPERKARTWSIKELAPHCQRTCTVAYANDTSPTKTRHRNGAAMSTAQLWLGGLGTLLAAIATGYAVAAAIAVRMRRAAATRPLATLPPATILKPL